MAAPRPFRVAVLTISDLGAQGKRRDSSGPAVVAMLQDAGFETVGPEILPDERARIAVRLRELAGTVDAVLTTGGTGFGPRDVTPEATLEVCDRLAPGLAELMRGQSAALTPNAWLSRAVAGIRQNTLILNLPGSPRGAQETLALVVPLLSHAMTLLRGETAHGTGSS